MSLHYDVVDGNVNEFDKKANEAHDSKTNSSGKGNLLKFCKKNEMIHCHAQKWKSERPVLTNGKPLKYQYTLRITIKPIICLFVVLKATGKERIVYPSIQLFQQGIIPLNFIILLGLITQDPRQWIDHLYRSNLDTKEQENCNLEFKSA